MNQNFFLLFERYINFFVIGFNLYHSVRSAKHTLLIAHTICSQQLCLAASSILCNTEIII
jgi:hypothetical protein